MTSVDISAISQLERHAKTHPDMIAVIYEEAEISYASLYERAGRLANGLRAHGVGAGDRVAYAGLNSITFLTTYFATIWVGAAFLPINFRLAPPEVLAVLQDATPSAVVAEPSHARTIDGLSGQLSVPLLIVADDDALAGSAEGIAEAWTPLSEISSGGSAQPHVPQHDDDLAALLYTSGTTGRPKGVMLTHGNLWWNWVNVDGVVDTRVGDVSLAVAPLFHIGGLNALSLRTLTRGGTLIVRRTFDPGQALDDLVRYRVNSMFLVAAMLAAIQRQAGFEDADLSALRSTIAAGAPVPPALIELYADKGVLLQQAWGLTETSPFSTYLEAAMTRDKLGSCGVGMPYTKVKVVDVASLEEITEPGVRGELWVSGPNVSRGYWNNTEATAAVFTSDGWFRTGDIGYVDADGYFFIVDRLKDMVISGGENVYPAEVEIVLSAHPGISDVAIIGIPDERWGEAVCAVISFNAEPLSLDHIRTLAARALARYKLPTRMVVLETVPRNGAGKLDKPRIRMMVAELDPSSIITDSTPPITESVTVPEA